VEEGERYLIMMTKGEEEERYLTDNEIEVGREEFM